MKFTILGFNQKKLIEFGLDSTDALILRYFIDFKDSGEMVSTIIENKTFYWIKYEAILQQLPILKLKKDSAYRRLKKMCSSEILEHKTIKKNGIYSFYTIGKGYIELITELDSSNKSEINPIAIGNKSVPYRKQIRKGSDLNPEQNINLLKDKSIKDNIEQIWSLYPNKKGKAKAINKIPKLINQYGYEQIERCVKRYAKERQEEDKKYIQHGSTFFNGGYMDYLDSNYKETKENTKSWGGKNFNE
ncbi:hypothetical protein FDE94_14955 [Clostridium botulinum]|nr:hypothetical protein [Clostridium botulinum]